MKHFDLFKIMGAPHLASIQVNCYSISWSNNSHALIIIANMARLAWLTWFVIALSKQIIRSKRYA